jgi:hypothetical protein
VLWSAHPLPIAGVLSAAGLPDLAQTKAEATEACGVDTVDKLVGAATANHPDVFADTSAVSLVPLGIDQHLVVGSDDPIAPKHFSESYEAAAVAGGDRVSISTVPGAGHFELITPAGKAWDFQLKAIDIMLDRKP